MRGGLAALAWIAAALLLSNCGSDGARTKQDIVRIGIAAEPYPPFAVRSAGEWVGFEIDLYRAVCEAEGLRCEPVEIPWDNIIPALVDRRIDVIWSSMSITEEREAVIDFTDMYYDTIHVLIGAASDPTRPSVEDPGSLAGKTIGVQEATIFADFVTKEFGDVAKVRLYSTLNEALSALESGEVDCPSLEAFIDGPDVDGERLFPEGIFEALLGETALHGHLTALEAETRAVVTGTRLLPLDALAGLLAGPRSGAAADALAIAGSAARRLQRV